MGGFGGFGDDDFFGNNFMSGFGGFGGMDMGGMGGMGGM